VEYSAYPEVKQPVTTIPTEGVGFLLRAVAKIIDLIVHNVIGLPFGFLVGVIIGYVATSSGNSIPDLSTENSTWQLVNGGFAIAGFILYCTICEAYCGTTLGKLILGLFVVNKKGEQISFGAGLIRSILFFFDSFFFGLVGYAFMKDSPLKLRLGDRAAGTIVIKRSDVNSPEIPSGCMVVIVLAIGLIFDAVIQVLPILIRAAGAL
jgi:uncharacterized RDD family membrane protein YckC